MNGDLLKAEIIRRGMKVSEVAKKIQISQPSLSQRLAGVREFKNSEIADLMELQNLTPEETVAIFFK